MFRRAALAATVALLALVAAAPARAGDPIMPLSQVHRGMHCTGYTVIQGTDVSSFDVEVLDVVVAGTGLQGAQILVRASGPAVAGTGVAAGFSGSPVYCADDGGVQRVIGAIANGLGDYGSSTVLVTPIEAILGETPDPPVGARHDRALLRSARPLATPLTVSGVSGPVARALTLAAVRAHRPLVVAPAAPASSFPAQTLRPGSSLAVGLASGDIGLSAIGTVTYTDGDRVWGFGHPLDGAGRRSLLIQDAYVYTVIGNPLGLDNLGVGSYKLASAGHDLGTLTNDAPNAVVGHLGPLPRLVPLRVVAHDGDTGRIEVTTASLADESPVDLPTGTSPMSLAALVGILSPAANILHGSPARETARLCVQIRLRERRRPLGFCNRYVSGTPVDLDTGGTLSAAVAGMASDFSLAATSLDDYEVGPLHVAGISADLTVSRGLRQATILGATAPSRVRAGGRLPLRLRVARRDGTRSTVRFRVRVPRTLRGVRRLRLRGADLDTGDDSDLLGALSSTVTIDLGGGDSGDALAGPHSVSELASDVAAIHRFDGITARFTKGGDGVPAFRDRRERIGGSAAVTVRVLPPG